MLLSGLPFGFLFVMIFLFVCAPAVIFGLIGIVVWGIPAALWKRRWRQALSMFAFPLMVVLALPAMQAAGSTRDEARFYIHKGSYDAKAAAAKAAGKHIAWVDDWSIFFNANDFVVWDEWDDPETDSGFKLEQRFGGHFYLVGD